MVLDKSYRLNTTQEFQILLRTEKAFAWQETKRCLNSIERSAEEQKTVQEIPYTPFLRVKIKRRAVSFYDFGKHDWPLWDMTNWPKHLAEKHYFGVKHLSVESSLASHEKLQKAKFVGILESSLKSMSHEKSFEVQPKISGDSLISKVALMRQARNSSYIQRWKLHIQRLAPHLKHARVVFLSKILRIQSVSRCNAF